MDALVVTASEAAQLLRVSNAKVLEELRSGAIKAYRDGKGWKIPVSVLEEYVQQRAEQETRDRMEGVKDGQV